MHCHLLFTRYYLQKKVIKSDSFSFAGGLRDYLDYVQQIKFIIYYYIPPNALRENQIIYYLQATHFAKVFAFAVW
jgi:hypothetical protein